MINITTKQKKKNCTLSLRQYRNLQRRVINASYIFCPARFTTARKIGISGSKKKTKKETNVYAVGVKMMQKQNKKKQRNQIRK